MTKKFSKILTEIYETNNSLYFNGRLPRLKVYFAPLHGKTYGETIFDLEDRRAIAIHINSKIGKLGWDCTATITMLHEMCHVSIGVQGDGTSAEKNHDEVFQAEKRRIIVLGAFDDLL